MTTPPLQRLIARIVLAFGSTFGRERNLLDYSEPNTTTGFRGESIPFELPAGSTDLSIDLSDYVDEAVWLAVIDESSTGIKVGLQSGAGKMQVAADGVLTYKNGDSTPPVLYLDNVSGSEKCFGRIALLGSSN